MSRVLLPLAGLLLVFGPGVVLLGGGLAFFSVGVVVLGVHGLTHGKDKVVGWALIFVGATALVAAVIRALLR